MANELVPSALTFLKGCQNLDGGSEGLDTHIYPKAPVNCLGWAGLGILAHLRCKDGAIIRGVKCLLETQVDMEDGGRRKEGGAGTSIY